MWTALHNPDNVACSGTACDGQLSWYGQDSSSSFAWSSSYSGGSLSVDGGGELCVLCDYGSCQNKKCNADTAAYFCQCVGRWADRDYPTRQTSSSFTCQNNLSSYSIFSYVSTLFLPLYEGQSCVQCPIQYV